MATMDGKSTYSCGVECITTREACIRELLSGSSYCHTFKLEECLSACEKHGLPPTALPSIVDELNSRRAKMDCEERLFYHIAKASRPTTDSRQSKDIPRRMRFYDWIVYAFFN